MEWIMWLAWMFAVFGFGLAVLALVLIFHLNTLRADHAEAVHKMALERDATLTALCKELGREIDALEETVNRLEGK